MDPLNEMTYVAALDQIRLAWKRGAGDPGHLDHAEFHALYLQVTAYEEEAGVAQVPQQDFVIDSLERLEWYVGKKADLQSKKARLKAQAEAMLRDLERTEERLDWRYSQQAEQVLRMQLTGRSKSVKFLTGTVGLRKVPGRVQVIDESALQQAIQALHPELGEVIVPRIDTALLSRLVKVEGEQAFVTEDGTVLELPGLGVVPSGEKFFVRAGKETLE